MKASFIILGLVSVALGADINSESRAWTGWDPRVRSADDQEARAWTGWDPKVRSTEDNVWTGWDPKVRSMENSDEDSTSRSNEDSGEDRAYTGWDIASRSSDDRSPSRSRSLTSMVNGVNELVARGKQIHNDVRDELKVQLRARLRDMVEQVNKTLNYYCDKGETGNYTCSVCAMMIANNNLCSNLIIDTVNISATVNIKVNNLTLISRSIGVKQPPPICVPMPHLPMFSFCLKAYDIDFSLQTPDIFKGCLEAELGVGVLAWKESMDVPLVCMNHDAEGFHFNRTESTTKPTKKPSALKRLFKI